MVITKKHYSSYIFGVPDKVMIGLTKAAKQVGLLLDRKLDDVGRTGLIYEGFGIDHLHAKLFPMHGTEMADWHPIKAKINKYFDKYESYISSHGSHLADDEELQRLADKLRD